MQEQGTEAEGLCKSLNGEREEGEREGEVSRTIARIANATVQVITAVYKQPAER